MNKKTNIDNDLDNEISWQQIKIALIIEFVIFLLLYIFGNIFKIDTLLINHLNLDINNNYIKYILINFIFILSTIDGICILKYRKNVIIGTILVLTGIIYAFHCLRVNSVIFYIVLGINLISIILFIIFNKNMNLFKYLLISLLPFILLTFILIIYIALFLLAILIVIWLIIFSFSNGTYNNRTELEKNKGYIDDTTVNTKWIDEYGKEHLVENYDKNDQSFEYEGTKYKIEK